MGSEKEPAAGSASSGESALSVRFWDADGDPALGLETIGVDALAHRHALLLVMGPDARADGWAHAAAVALARELAEHGRRVVLADLDFEAPALHARLGEPNADGLGDVFFFGASLEHVTLTWSARRFGVIPAGAGVPDPRAVLEHTGWRRVLGCFETGEDPAGDLLIAFVPAEAPGIDALARRIGAAVVLGVPHECAAIAASLPYGVQRVASFAPEVSATHEIEAGRDMLTPRPTIGGPHETVTAVPVIEDAATPAPLDARGDASRRRLERGLTLVALLLLCVLVSVWHFGARETDLATGADRKSVV